MFRRRAVEYAVNAENLNLSAIRTIRVLRPIRAINRIPSKFANVSSDCSPADEPNGLDV